MTAEVANIHQAINLVNNEEVLKALSTLLAAYVPQTKIEDELSKEEQEMLKIARAGEYESLDD